MLGSHRNRWVVVTLTWWHSVEGDITPRLGKKRWSHIVSSVTICPSLFQCRVQISVLLILFWLKVNKKVECLRFMVSFHKHKIFLSGHERPFNNSLHSCYTLLACSALSYGAQARSLRCLVSLHITSAFCRSIIQRMLSSSCNGLCHSSSWEFI